MQKKEYNRESIKHMSTKSNRKLNKNSSKKLTKLIKSRCSQISNFKNNSQR